eukprot:787948-Pleurochrysis_carterae.AAC.1
MRKARVGDSWTDLQLCDSCMRARVETRIGDGISTTLQELAADATRRVVYTIERQATQRVCVVKPLHLSYICHGYACRYVMG